MYDEFINATDSAPTNVTNTRSTNMTNTISTNVASTVPINSNDKKVRHKAHVFISDQIITYNRYYLLSLIITNIGQNKR